MDSEVKPEVKLVDFSGAPVNTEEPQAQGPVQFKPFFGAEAFGFIQLIFRTKDSPDKFLALSKAFYNLSREAKDQFLFQYLLEFAYASQAAAASPTATEVK